MRIRKFIGMLSAMAVIGTALFTTQCTEPLWTLGTYTYAKNKLEAPQNPSALVNSDSVTLKWNTVKGADKYRIYEYDSPTKKYIRVKTTSKNKAVIRNLSLGEHDYKIAAVDKTSKGNSVGYLSRRVKITIKSNSPEEVAVNLPKKMGNGWNLGNTMESVADWLGSDATAYDYEKAWGEPTTTKEIISNLKKANFNSVRVPVAWSNMMSDNGSYTISKSYFDRVDEIIGYVLDNDMYCIINIHWDGGWWEDFGSENENVRVEAMKKYKALWTQIAEHYSEYSEKLIFESANEELGSSTKGNSDMNESYERVNQINQAFVDVVRSTGAKNEKRFLLIAGYDTNIDRTCDNRFIMPKDTVTGKLLVSVHFYTPSTFCIAESKDNSWGYMGSWGTDADISAMKREFAKMKKFTEAGYGVIIGEYGVAKEKNDDTYSIKDGTDKFFANVKKFADEYGYCAMLWDCNTWYNRNTCAFNDKEIEDIYK